MSVVSFNDVYARRVWPTHTAQTIDHVGIGDKMTLLGTRRIRQGLRKQVGDAAEAVSGEVGG